MVKVNEYRNWIKEHWLKYLVLVKMGPITFPEFQSLTEEIILQNIIVLNCIYQYIYLRFIIHANNIFVVKGRNFLIKVKDNLFRGIFFDMRHRSSTQIRGHETPVDPAS